MLTAPFEEESSGPKSCAGFFYQKKKKKKKIKKMRYISKTWNMSGEVLAPCMLTMPAFHTHTH